MLEIDDSQILMYLDGLAILETKALIEREPMYQVRAQELGRQQGKWVAQLYRVDCPDTLILGEYHLGVLSPAQEKAIQKHQATCVHCARELGELAAFVPREPLVQPGILEQVERLVARLVSGRHPLRASSGLPGLGLRGGETGGYQYEAGRAKIGLGIEEDVEHPGYQALVGIIAGLEAENYEVSLWQAGIIVGKVRVDELGGFTLGSLQPGEYQLVIHGPKVEIQVQSFVI